MCVNHHANKSVDSKIREALINWVGDFLWHVEGAISGHGPEKWPDDPATIIVDTILQYYKAQNFVEGVDKEELFHLPEPSFYFQIE